MEGVLNQRYHGHHGGQDGHCIIMTMMQTIAIHSHTYHCFCPIFILFFMRIDSPATCMNHLAAFHRAQSAQPDAGSMLLSQRATSFSRNHLHIHTQYMSASSWLAYLSRELSSGSANYRALYVSIKLSPTKLKIHLCRTGPALGFTSTLGRYETLHRPNSRKNYKHPTRLNMLLTHQQIALSTSSSRSSMCFARPAR